MGIEGIFLKEILVVLVGTREGKLGRGIRRWRGNEERWVGENEKEKGVGKPQ